VKGCLDWLRRDVTWAWLYGGTGHAFALNIHEVVCPSGPTAWHSHRMVFDLGPNVGYRVSTVSGFKHAEDFAARQQEAWDFVRGGLDASVPCFGWELDVPEYYVIHGYDDVGYYYSGAGCDDGAGPKAWQALGDTGIGWLQVSRLALCDPAPAAQTVRAALEAVLDHTAHPENWSEEPYRTGLRGYEAWAEALEQGKADAFGEGYNAVVWAECRAQAVDFLGEAAQRLEGLADDLFDEAAAHFTVVRDRLRALSDLHPFRHGVEGTITSPEAGALVREAAAAESRGLEVLGRIVEAL